MFDLISIGTVSIDLYFKGESLTCNKDRFELAIGGKYFVDHFYEGLGGGGTNVAIGAQKQSLKVALFGKIGDNPFKKIILEKLDEVGVTYHTYCHIEKEYSNISSILLADSGEKTVINYRTPHQHFLQCEADLHKLSHASAVYLSNMPNVSWTQRLEMLSYVKNSGGITIVNVGVVDCKRSKDQLDELLKKTDILIINAFEFADLVKQEYKDIHFKQNVIQKYLPEWKGILIITDGKEGSYGFLQEASFYQPSEEVHKVVDTTGAGDGYTAGFISSYLKKKDIQQAMKQGAEYAVKILGKIGAN
jgi:fructokinase